MPRHQQLTTLCLLFPYQYNKKESDIIKNYHIQNYLEKIQNGTSTPFLEPNERQSVISHLPKNTYNIYYPYPESEKTIIYKDKPPRVKLIEITSKAPLRHQDILGSLYSINLDYHTYGDIIITNNHHYIFILAEIYPYLLSHLLTIGKNPITIDEVDINTLSNYTHPYTKHTTIVSTTRIDAIISAITHLSRKDIQTKIKEGEVILNYNPLTNPNTKLKANDIFSIRKYGKYQYIGIDAQTKKDKHIITYHQY